MLTNMVCPATPVPFNPSKGISNPNPISDSTTGRIPAAMVQAMIADRRRQGLLPSIPIYSNPPGDLATQINKDADMFKQIQTEYCYYEAQYKRALSEYLTDATSTDSSLNATANTRMRNVVELNARLNSLLEIMNALAQERADNVQQNKQSVNQLNATISKKLSDLQAQYNRIKKDDNTILRQTRMVEYTKEKNEAVSNQIGLYIALNVAAIGMIFFVSRSL